MDYIRILLGLYRDYRDYTGNFSGVIKGLYSGYIGVIGYTLGVTLG